MKTLFKSFINNMAHIMIIFLFASCSTSLGFSRVGHHDEQSAFRVVKVKRVKDDVYMICAERNDSIFRIYSFFDKDIAFKGQKLKKGVFFRANIEPIFVSVERKFNLMPNYGMAVLYHGVKVMRSKKDNYQDTFTSPDLNGLWVRNDSDLFNNHRE